MAFAREGIRTAAAYARASLRCCACPARGVHVIGAGGQTRRACSMSGDGVLGACSKVPREWGQDIMTPR